MRSHSSAVNCDHRCFLTLSARCMWAGIRVLYARKNWHNQAANFGRHCPNLIAFATRRPGFVQQTTIHASGGIRTHNLSRRAAAVLRPRGHGDNLCVISVCMCEKEARCKIARDHINVKGLSDYLK